MNNAEKLVMAERLRKEAEDIRQHGLSNFFEHTYSCIQYGQVPKEKAEDRCHECPVRPYVPWEFQQETFPCQHVTPEGWEMAADVPDFAAQVAASLLRNAAQLEAEVAVAAEKS